MPGTFTYDAGTNTVTVTGGTSGSPATFGDFVAADRAGTLNSQDARDITGVDGNPVAVTRAIRPVERLVLGGPAHTLYLFITNWNVASATIRIAGTDYDGNGQQEDIAISGNGTLYAVNRYKTVTSTQVTALSGTGFTYTLTQAGWGVIWDKGNGQYQVDCLFNVGDGSNSTYFKIYQEESLFTPSDIRPIKVWSNATFYADESSVGFPNSTSGFIKAWGGTNTFIILENSFIHSINGSNIEGYGGTAETFTISNCLFNRVGLYSITPSSSVYKCIFVNSSMPIQKWNCSCGDILILDSQGNPVGLTYITAPGTATFRNITVSNNLGSYDVRGVSSSGTAYLVDCDLEDWVVSLADTFTGDAFRQYTFNLHVTNKDGNPISGATINLYDKNNDPVWTEDSKMTDENGDLGTFNGIGDHVSSVNNAVSHTRYYYDVSSQEETYNDFTLVIEKSGYQTYQQVISIDRKMDLEVAMLASVAAGGVSPVQPSLLPLGVMEVVA